MPDSKSLSEQPTKPGTSARGIDRLLHVMSQLRDPVGGCPWDLAQSYETIVPHTVEEAYEVAETIERGDTDALKDELGDLLFQVVFYARLAQEEERFDFDAIADAHADKMISRHPHVFSKDNKASADDVHGIWEAKKADERAKKAKQDGQKPPSALDGVIPNLPAMTRALKLQKRAARVGFDWPDIGQVIEKVDEELLEIKELLPDVDASLEIEKPRMTEEIGDLLFAVVNAARHMAIDPEAALRATNRKFESRFHFVEQSVEDKGISLTDATLEEMESAWVQAKSTK